MFKQNIVCGLDIGTSKVRAVCGRLGQGREVDILGVESAPSEGMASSRIVSVPKLSNSVRGVLAKLRKSSGVKIKRVFVNIDSFDLMLKKCLQDSQDVQINKRLNSYVGLNRKLVYLDWQAAQGSCGGDADNKKLEAVVVSAALPTVNSVIGVIKSAGVTLGAIVPSGYARFLALSKQTEESPGKDIVLIDFGAGSVKVCFFKNGLIRDIKLVSLGAVGITEEIARKLKVSRGCAEELKIKYGRVIDSEDMSEEKIIVKDGALSLIVQRRELCAAISARVNADLRQIKKILQDLGGAGDVSSTIVTGGGAVLEGFLERAEEIFARPIQMGFLYALKNSVVQEQGAVFSTSVGLIRCSRRLKKIKRSVNFRDKLTSLDAARWWREFYKEYF